MERGDAATTHYCISALSTSILYFLCICSVFVLYFLYICSIVYLHFLCIFSIFVLYFFYIYFLYICSIFPPIISVFSLHFLLYSFRNFINTPFLFFATFFLSLKFWLQSLCWTFPQFHNKFELHKKIKLSLACFQNGEAFKFRLFVRDQNWQRLVISQCGWPAQC